MRTWEIVSEGGIDELLLNDRPYADPGPGEVLVMVTDGILERPDPEGEFFGDERLRAVVRGHPGASAGEILEAIFEAASTHGQGRPWDDDATVVVVRRDEEPSPSA